MIVITINIFIILINLMIIGINFFVQREVNKEINEKLRELEVEE